MRTLRHRTEARAGRQAAKGRTPGVNPQTASGRRACRLLLLLPFFLTSCFKQIEPIEFETGYKGEARFNPFLAATRFLGRMGVPVEERYNLNDLPGTDVVLMVSAESDESMRGAEQLSDWIQAGGHLIYFVQGGDRLQNDWGLTMSDLVENQDGDDEADAHSSAEVGEEFPLLVRAGVKVVTRSGATDHLRLGRSRLEVEFPPGSGLKVPKKLRRLEGVNLAGDPAALVFVTSPWKAGRLTVLADAHPWRNRYIGEGDHAGFFWEVVNLQGRPRAAWFVHGTRTSFFQLLWRHAWMALLCLALFTVFWLWRAVMRFGPPIPDPSNASRAFVGHLEMVGWFFWRQHEVDGMLAPLRHRIRRQGARLLRGTGPGEEAGRLAEVTGLNVEQVELALSGPAPKNRKQFLDMVATLQKIETAFS